MTLQVSRPEKRAPVKTETKQAREARLKKARAKKHELRERLVEDDDAVLTVAEWCALSGFSPRVGRTVLNGDNGPVVTQLSARRLGITRKHHREWLEKRSTR